MAGAALTIGVLREAAPGERRVALVPEVLGRIAALGGAVVVETGAGEAAWFSDEAYQQAGAEIADADTVHERADILVRVGPPSAEQMEKMRDSRAHAGLLRPFERATEVAGWAARGITTVCLDLLPRTLSRAQTMDALTSQSSAAGYRAVLRAAGHVPRLVPDADDGGRHGQAGRGAGAGYRSRRAAGHRDRPPTGRQGVRVRHPTVEPGRGDLARRAVRGTARSRRRRRIRRVRAGADRRRAAGAASCVGRASSRGRTW